jgi:hypothetical protein
MRFFRRKAKDNQGCDSDNSTSATTTTINDSDGNESPKPVLYATVDTTFGGGKLNSQMAASKEDVDALDTASAKQLKDIEDRRKRLLGEGGEESTEMFDQRPKKEAEENAKSDASESRSNPAALYATIDSRMIAEGGDSGVIEALSAPKADVEALDRTAAKQLQDIEDRRALLFEGRSAEAVPEEATPVSLTANASESRSNPAALYATIDSRMTAEGGDSGVIEALSAPKADVEALDRTAAKQLQDIEDRRALLWAGNVDALRGNSGQLSTVNMEVGSTLELLRMEQGKTEAEEQQRCINEKSKGVAPITTVSMSLVEARVMQQAAAENRVEQTEQAWKNSISAPDPNGPDPNTQSDSESDPNTGVDPNAGTNPNAEGTDPNAGTNPNAEETDPNAGADLNAEAQSRREIARKEAEEEHRLRREQRVRTEDAGEAQARKEAEESSLELREQQQQQQEEEEQSAERARRESEEEHARVKAREMLANREVEEFQARKEAAAEQARNEVDAAEVEEERARKETAVQAKKEALLEVREEVEQIVSAGAAQEINYSSDEDDAEGTSTAASPPSNATAASPPGNAPQYVTGHVVSVDGSSTAGNPDDSILPTADPVDKLQSDESSDDGDALYSTGGMDVNVFPPAAATEHTSAPTSTMGMDFSDPEFLAQMPQGFGQQPGGVNKSTASSDLAADGDCTQSGGDADGGRASMVSDELRNSTVETIAQLIAHNGRGDASTVAAKGSLAVSYLAAKKAEREKEAQLQMEVQAKKVAEEAEREEAVALQATREAAEEQAKRQAVALQATKQAAEEQAKREAAEEQAKSEAAEEQATSEAAEEQKTREAAETRSVLERANAFEAKALEREAAEIKQAEESERARREAEAQQKKEGLEQVRLEAELATKQAGKEQAERQAAEQARKVVEERAKKEANEQSKKEAEKLGFRPCEFSSPFDRGGAMYFIATGAWNGHKEYTNPHTSGEVVIKMSSVYRGGPENIVEHNPSTDEHSGVTQFKMNCTENQKKSWVSIDIGAARRLVLKHYSFRHGNHDGDGRMRNWRVQASHNGNKWKTIQTHAKDKSLPDCGFAVGAWPVEPPAEGPRVAYRYFRILQHGMNSDCIHMLCCCGLELYGDLKKVELSAPAAASPAPPVTVKSSPPAPPLADSPAMEAARAREAALTREAGEATRLQVRLSAPAEQADSPPDSFPNTGQGVGGPRTNTTGQNNSFNYESTGGRA